MDEHAKAVEEYGDWNQTHERMEVGDAVNITLEGIVVTIHEVDCGMSCGIFIHDANRIVQTSIPSKRTKVVKVDSKTGCND